MKKLTDLRPCDRCGGPVGFQFYTVRTSLTFVKLQAVQQFAGMHMFFGGRASAALIENFAPEAADAVIVAGDQEPKLMTEFVICSGCYLDHPIDLPMLTEQRNAARRSSERDSVAAADSPVEEP